MTPSWPGILQSWTIIEDVLQLAYVSLFAGVFQVPEGEVYGLEGGEGGWEVIGVEVLMGLDDFADQGCIGYSVGYSAC
ncbi:hypothetical protein [Candidatus Electrothrix sp.]|uniref:hypothetical protein n=1 Tax=Candidatus Electrothrix sp. TaxID=2170559 RepID=UPI0040573095